MTKIVLNYENPKMPSSLGACQMKIVRDAESILIPPVFEIYPSEWDSRRCEIRLDNAGSERMQLLLKAKHFFNEEMKTLNCAIRQLDATDVGYTLGELLRRYQKVRFRLNFFDLVEARIQHMREAGQLQTANNYACALNVLRMFCGQSVLATDDLTVSLMKDFQNFMIARHLSLNTISLYNRNLRAVYNFALDEEILKMDKHPFRKVFTGIEPTRKRAIKSDVVRRLIHMDLNDNVKMRFSRDLFLFSIYTQGMAFVDLAHLRIDNLSGQKIFYRRHKTNQRIEIELVDCAREIIDRYHESDSPYLFPILYDREKQHYRKYSTALRMYNRELHVLSQALQLDIPLSSYVARHTWASLAKWNGISSSVISEAMGHRNAETTRIYLASLDMDVITDANHTVIHSLME